MSDITGQNSETSEETLTKSTVSVRLELPKSVHRRAMKKHANNPRHMTFADSLIEMIKNNLATENQSA